MLCHTAEYALRGCLELARRWEQGPVPVEEIARSLSVPRNYLSKILHDLGQAGIVESTRGPRGGFELARPPTEISLKEIVGHYQPQLVSGEARCILGREQGGREPPCAAHGWWTEISGEILAFLSKTTLANLTEPYGEASRPPR